jgi:hypothetical protein
MSTAIVPFSAMGGDTTAVSTIPAINQIALPSPSTSLPTASTYGSITASGAGTDMTHASGMITSLTAPIQAGGLGNRRMDQTMADTSFADVLHRNVALFDWGTTPLNFSLQDAIVGGELWSPWMDNPLVAEKLTNFNYITGSLIVSGVLKAPPMSSGLVSVSFSPSYQGGVGFIERSLCTVTEHVLLDLSASTDFEVTLPWVGASNWGNLEDRLFSDQWIYTVRVLDAIQSSVPEGCTMASLQMFIRPGPDFRLSGATYQSGLSRVSHSSHNKTIGGYHGSSSSIGRPPQFVGEGGSAPQMIQDGAAATVRATGYKPSQLLGGAGWAVGAIGGMAASVYPPAGVVGAMGAGALGMASKIFDYFGMTRESVVPKTEEAFIKPSTNLISCNGDDSSRVSALFNFNALSPDPSISGTLSSLDETSLAYIYSRYTLIGHHDFTAGEVTPADFVLPVTPYMFTETYPIDTLIPTTAGYIGSRFSYWRGDVEFLFYPVVSAATRGALQFIWQPVPDSDATIGVDYTNISVNAIVDVACATPIEIKIGYNNDEPACFQDFYSMATPMDPALDYLTLNGYLRVRNISPFTSSICGQRVRVLVFARAGSNMEFGKPDDTIFIEGEPFVPGQTLQRRVLLQSGTIGSVDQSLVSIQLVPSSGMYPVANNLFGEEIRSVRALVQKPSPRSAVTDFLYDPSDGSAFPYPHTTHIGERSSAYMDWFGTMFLGFAGSIRNKIIVDRKVSESSGTFTALDLTPMVTPGSSTEGCVPLGEINPTITEITSVAEYNTPYYHNELYVPAYKHHSDYRDRLIWQTPSEDMPIRMAHYQSVGPDARLVYFRAQNGFDIVAAPPASVPNIFNVLTVPGPAPAPLAREAEPGVMSMSDERYYELTGRKKRKVPPKGHRGKHAYLSV